MDYSAALQQLFPGKQWTCGETRESIVIHDGTPTPTEAELQSAEAAWKAAEPARIKAAIKAIYDASENNPKLLRAVCETLLDEVNGLRQWITSFKAATAASSSLADLKNRVAALGNMPDRTAAQARAAIFSKIDA